MPAPPADPHPVVAYDWTPLRDAMLAQMHKFLFTDGVLVMAGGLLGLTVVYVYVKRTLNQMTAEWEREDRKGPRYR